MGLWFCFSQVDKFLPLYKRKKPQPRPVVFEIIPSSGTLCPGEQFDVQIKFCPAEGVKLLFISNIMRKIRLVKLGILFVRLVTSCMLHIVAGGLQQAVDRLRGRQHPADLLDSVWTSGGAPASVLSICAGTWGLPAFQHRG